MQWLDLWVINPLMCGFSFTHTDADRLGLCSRAPLLSTAATQGGQCVEHTTPPAFSTTRLLLIRTRTSSYK